MTRGDETALWEHSDATHQMLLATTDMREGVSVFFERRTPTWTAT